MPLDFLDGSYRSHIGRIALAAGDLLAADTGLNVWCGGAGVYGQPEYVRGRIHLPIHPFDTPEGAWPMVLVYALSEVPSQVSNAKVNITGTIVVAAVWDDERLTLDDGKPGAESLGSYIRRLLVTDSAALHFKVPRFANRSMVDSVTSMGQLRVGPELTKEQLGRVLFNEEDPSDFSPRGLRLEVQLDCLYQVDRTTWTPQGFSPEE